MHETATSTIQAIIIVTCLLALASGFVIGYFLYFKKRKSKLIEENAIMRKEFEELLFHSRIEVQEQTFQKISRELHDNVCQLLSSSRMLLGITERSLPSAPSTLVTANNTLAKAINEIRTLSKSLDKEWLKKFSLHENLEAEIDRIEAGGIIHARLQVDGTINLIPDEQIILFRIVQESIQNAIRHGNPGNIFVKISNLPDKTTIVVRNDGKAFDPNKTEGMGIHNMKQRAAILGGTIRWQTSPGPEISVSICIPRRRN